MSPRLLLFAWILALSSTFVIAEEAAPSRADILATLAVTDAQLPDINSPQPPQAAPHEKDSTLLALQKMASARPDAELIATLLRYQLAYLSPENALPARVMGVVFLEQPDLFVQVYNGFPAAARVILGSYLKFGFDKATEERNASSPQVKAARKKFDALQASLMNARSKDDAH